jgi:streptomycin 6-kinase
MHTTRSTELQRRLDDRIRAWGLTVERLLETESSILAFGRRRRQSIVLKVIRRCGEEWRSGRTLEAFDGCGVVRALDHVGGAVLLERLEPGDSLVSMVLNDRDDQATAILAEVIDRLPACAPTGGFATVQEWSGAFDRYKASGGGDIPRPLIDAAQDTYAQLCTSQSQPRLLHGDLHHYNVLLDTGRGWLAIDPKGVIGELEYEIGAALRNPSERPDVFAAPSVIRRRVDRFARALNLDPGRILAWAFAQAVLATVWAVEDGPRNPPKVVAPGQGWIALAGNIRPLLKGIVDG